MNSVKVALNHGILAITGELNRYSITDIKDNDYISWFAHSAVKVDLGGVTKVDTAGLAWAFYLIEQANHYACQLSFTNIPDKLSKLITLSGVDGLLPMACD